MLFDLDNLCNSRYHLFMVILIIHLRIIKNMNLTPYNILKYKDKFNYYLKYFILTLTLAHY